MTLLPQHLEREDDFILLRQYLTDDDGDKRKLFQLAAKAADLYDQYLVYRPEWLMRWEAGQRVEGLGDAQQWQAPLWKALVEYTAELGSRAGTAPISISALSKRWKKRTNRPPGCRRASSSAGFPRCRRSIFRRCRRWVNMSMSISCLPTPAVITGATLKIRRFWRSCCRVSGDTVLRRAHYRCFATPSRRRAAL